MTVETTTSHKQYTAATGAIGETFTIPFKFVENADIQITTTDPATSIVTTLVRNVNFSLSGEGSPTGGTMTTLTAITAGHLVDIYNWPESKQKAGLPETGAFPSRKVENTLDKMMILIQNIMNRLGGIPFTTAALKFIGLVAGKSDEWDGEGFEATNFADPTAAQSLATRTWVNGQIGASTGNVPAPGAPDVGFVLEATGVGTFDWRFALNTAPVAGDKGKTARATGADAFAWHDVPGRNLIHNPQFAISQRGIGLSPTYTYTAASTPYTNDDASFLHDRWMLLSDGNDIVDVRRTNDVPAASFKTSMRATVQTINKKFGFVQYLASEDAEAIIGGTASLSFWAKTITGNVLNNLRAAIIAWDGSEDLPTLDCISAWGATGVDPTLVANFTYENVPSNLALVADTWTQYKIENVSIDTASAQNVAVLIWLDDTDAAVGDELYMTGVQLEEGSVSTAFEYVPIAVQEIKCQRYFQLVTIAFVGDTTGTATYRGQSSGTVELHKDPSCTGVYGASSSSKFSDPVAADYQPGDSDTRQSRAELAATGTDTAQFWRASFHLEAEIGA